MALFFRLSSVAWMVLNGVEKSKSIKKKKSKIKERDFHSAVGLIKNRMGSSILTSLQWANCIGSRNVDTWSLRWIRIDLPGTKFFALTREKIVLGLPCNLLK